MPYFTCKTCKQDVSYNELDLPLHESREFECPLCYSVLAEHKYPVNVAGANTWFSPMGSALGDTVIFKMVYREYVKDNPDEKIYTMMICDPDKFVDDVKPDKFFWASTTNFMPPPQKGATYYYLENEGKHYAAKGIYPDLWFNPLRSNIGGTYIAMHIRNVLKCPPKNAEPFIVNRIIELLHKLHEAGKFDKVVLVGNDEPNECIYIPDGYFVDLRKRLSLEELGGVLQGAKLFIGRDSGVAHLAGAAGCPVTAWGYVDPRWYVNAPAERLACFIKGEPIESIQKAINTFLGE